MGYACEGVELCKHILCVQIGCVGRGVHRERVTVMIHGSSISKIGGASLPKTKNPPKKEETRVKRL